jgi:gamma-glutamyl hercynylcysteine S-oxide synthase
MTEPEATPGRPAADDADQAGGRDAVGAALRRAGPAALAAALRESRQDTLATFAAYEAALPGLQVPLHPALNPPLWELGHIGWFQEFWIARNGQRGHGARADPDAPRPAPARPDADALYHSSLVPHDSRWSLPLPSAQATRDDLAAQLGQTLALLDGHGGDGDAATDDALYFHRLVLLHEDMHHEAALYMAQALGIAIDDPRWQPRALAKAHSPLHFDAGAWRLGSGGEGEGDGGGFAFDNELGAHELALGPTAIDARVQRWADFLPFVEAGGYAEARWWSDAGRAWLAATRQQHPRYLRRDGAHWQQQRWGRWLPLDMALAACHLSCFEAEAWCAWAGRRLPTEAEWERAALTRPEAFDWGQVWEWTASVFAPYPGFVAHPYRDYSQPWFGSRPVLRGAAFGTQPRLRHARYRNFFAAGRNDIFAGFRSCAP